MDLDASCRKVPPKTRRCPRQEPSHPTRQRRVPAQPWHVAALRITLNKHGCGNKGNSNDENCLLRTSVEGSCRFCSSIHVKNLLAANKAAFFADLLSDPRN
jgi:hypothetical protein